MRFMQTQSVHFVPLLSSTVSGVTNRSQGQTSGRWRDENREESHHDQRERQGACEKKYMKRKTQHAADEAKMEGIVECKEAVEDVSGVSTEVLEARQRRRVEKIGVA